VTDRDPEPEAEPAEQPRPTTGRVDPEDWTSTPADDDERYQQERPPHWE